MISKHRNIPLTMQKEEALIRRLPLHHPQCPAISDSLAKRRAGYIGEQAIDYHLQTLDENFFHIFHDIRLRAGQHFFQIDILLVTPQFLLIMEVKNFNGKLYFDTDFDQLIRTVQDREEGFRSPLSQAVLQQELLEQFLLPHGFGNLPIEFLIVISRSSTIIKSNNTDISKVVIHAHQSMKKIEELMKIHSEKKLTTSQLQRLKHLLLKKDVPLNPNILQKYQIPPSAILTGVSCPTCNFLPMVWNRRKWRCSSCHAASNSAYVQAIEDYLLLISPIISNKKCREFLHLPSRNTATKYLASMGLKRSGSTCGTVYQR